MNLIFTIHYKKYRLNEKYSGLVNILLLKSADSFFIICNINVLLFTYYFIDLLIDGNLNSNR